jgi:hypothetical protein
MHPIVTTAVTTCHNTTTTTFHATATENPTMLPALMEEDMNTVKKK